MTILDENIGDDQCEKLRLHRIRFRHIGKEIGEKGFDDYNQILPLLRAIGRATFFTCDKDYYRADWKHRQYAIIYLAVPPKNAADMILRFLKHADFNTTKKRLGKVIRVGENELTVLAE
jgi:hypothetical protein